MEINVLFCFLCGILNIASTDDASPVAIIIENSKMPNTRWDQLIPALKMIKNTTNIKKEKLHNIVKTIKNLLINETDKVSELKENLDDVLLKEKINESLKELSKDIVKENGLRFTAKEVDEKLNAIKKMIDDKQYMVNRDEIVRDIAVNKTRELNKILNKINATASKVKEDNFTEVRPEMRKTYKQNTNVENIILDFKTDDATSQSKLNPKMDVPEFTIPCQRASDILEETSNIAVPQEMYYDVGNVDFVAQNLRSILKKLPPGRIVPNSVQCIDTGKTVQMLFKPKTISLMQLFGNLLRQITITVLVPYHISKFTN